MTTAKRRNPLAPLPSRDGPARDYVTAKQATEALGIKRSSLYSYVSRGLIRSIVQPGQRTRLYYREDVERAGQRMGGRAGMPETVEAVLSWGQPLFHTSITDLAHDGAVYRGRPAHALADAGRSFESVAELLWSGFDMPQLRHWEPAAPPVGFVRKLGAALKDSTSLTPLRIMSVSTALLAVDSSLRPDFERGSTIADARMLIQTYAGALGFMGPPGRFIAAAQQGSPLADVLLRAWGVPVTAQHLRTMNAALILCADHEVSPSTLSARVAASCGGELRACLQAAIATHAGTLLAGGCERSEALLRGAASLEELSELMASQQRSGGRIPGYNLKAYPRGDPRARRLLALAATQGPAAAAIVERVSAVERRFDLKPSLEVGLVAVAAGLGLPPRGAAALWSVARVAGWVAHVIEQRQAGFMIRPRARYVGPAPAGDATG